MLFGPSTHAAAEQLAELSHELWREPGNRVPSGKKLRGQILAILQRRGCSGRVRKTCRVRIAWLFAFALSLVPAAHGQESAGYHVSVTAGNGDRHGAPVTFLLPEPLPESAWGLVSEDGRQFPVQVDREGVASFVLDFLEKGQVAELRLEERSGAVGPETGVRHTGGRVHLSAAGRQVLQYHAEKNAMPRPDIDPLYHRSGYLHPVVTPGGHVVTDDYPPNHIHHHGIWAAWTNTRFQGRSPDFWNMGRGTGRVEAAELEATWKGPVHAGLQARHHYVDMTSGEDTAALAERFEVRLYNTGELPYYLFDLVLEQRAATDSALALPTHLYGGVGFRGRREWDGAEHTRFLTSEGLDRSNGHATRARWCYIGGLVDGKPAGLAFLGHPENREAPQPMRIHPTEPFFNFAPSQASAFAIEPGEVHVLRYRVVVHDGEPDPELLDRLWYDYAHPPVALVKEP